MNQIKWHKLTGEIVESIEQIDERGGFLYGFTLVFMDGMHLDIEVKSQYCDHAWIEAELRRADG